MTLLDHEAEDAFWTALGGPGPVAGPVTRDPDSAQISESVLYRLEAEKRLRLLEVGRGVVSKAMLQSDDVFLLDIGTIVFVWIGKGASKSERRAAFSTAEKFLAHKKKDAHTPVCILSEAQRITNSVWLDVMKGA